jgi:hypothetical protein
VDRRKRQIRLSMKALQPEIIEEEKPQRLEKFDRPEREDRKERGEGKRRGKGKKREEQVEIDDEGPTEPQLTAMQIAWQEALERSKGRNKGTRMKTAKAVSQEQEELLNRTLEKRLPTGG